MSRVWVVLICFAVYMMTAGQDHPPALQVYHMVVFSTPLMLHWLLNPDCN